MPLGEPPRSRGRVPTAPGIPATITGEGRGIRYRRKKAKLKGEGKPAKTERATESSSANSQETNNDLPKGQRKAGEGGGN